MNGLINLSAPTTELVKTSPKVEIIEKEPKSLIELVIVAFDAVVTPSYLTATFVRTSSYKTLLPPFYPSNSIAITKSSFFIIN